MDGRRGRGFREGPNPRGGFSQRGRGGGTSEWMDVDEDGRRGGFRGWSRGFRGFRGRGMEERRWEGGRDLWECGRPGFPDGSWSERGDGWRMRSPRGGGRGGYLGAGGASDGLRDEDTLERRWSSSDTPGRGGHVGPYSIGRSSDRKYRGFGFRDRGAASWVDRSPGASRGDEAAQRQDPRWKQREYGHDNREWNDGISPSAGHNREGYLIGRNEDVLHEMKRPHVVKQSAPGSGPNVESFEDTGYKIRIAASGEGQPHDPVASHALTSTEEVEDGECETGQISVVAKGENGNEYFEASKVPYNEEKMHIPSSNPQGELEINPEPIVSSPTVGAHDQCVDRMGGQDTLASPPNPTNTETAPLEKDLPRDLVPSTAAVRENLDKIEAAEHQMKETMDQDREKDTMQQSSLLSREISILKEIEAIDEEVESLHRKLHACSVRKGCSVNTFGHDSAKEERSTQDSPLCSISGEAPEYRPFGLINFPILNFVRKVYEANRREIDRVNASFSRVLPNWPRTGGAVTDGNLSDHPQVKYVIEFTERNRRGLEDAVRKRRAAKRKNWAQLSKEYMDRRSKWIRTMNAADKARSREDVEASRDRDRYLFMSTRGSDLSSLARTGSGRVTTRPVGSDGGNGDSMSHLEVDIMLNEIEAAGGTMGGEERWGRNLAEIPIQDGANPPWDGGSVLVTDPIAEHFAARAQNPWTREERLIFLEKFLVYGKNFRKIASQIETKTVFEVQKFYFQNKLPLNLNQLTKTLKEGTNKRKGGTASKRKILLALSDFHVDGVIRKHPSLDFDKMKRNSEPVVGSEGGTQQSNAWSEREHALFLQGLVRFGIDFPEVSKIIKTRSIEDCRAFFKAHRKTLGLDAYVPLDKKTKIVRKSKTIIWDTEEEAELHRQLKRIGKDWKGIAEYLPNKTALQVKAYWTNNLSKKAKAAKQGEIKKPRKRAETPKPGDSGPVPMISEEPTHVNPSSGDSPENVNASDLDQVQGAAHPERERIGLSSGKPPLPPAQSVMISAVLQEEHEPNNTKQG